MPARFHFILWWNSRVVGNGEVKCAAAALLDDFLRNTNDDKKFYVALERNDDVFLNDLEDLDDLSHRIQLRCRLPLEYARLMLMIRWMLIKTGMSQMRNLRILFISRKFQLSVEMCKL